jgi:hypothetical protein
MAIFNSYVKLPEGKWPEGHVKALKLRLCPAWAQELSESLAVLEEIQISCPQRLGNQQPAEGFWIKIHMQYIYNTYIYIYIHIYM